MAFRLWAASCLLSGSSADSAPVCLRLYFFLFFFYFFFFVCFVPVREGIVRAQLRVHAARRRVRLPAGRAARHHELGPRLGWGYTMLTAFTLAICVMMPMLLWHFGPAIRRISTRGLPAGPSARRRDGVDKVFALSFTYLVANTV